MKRIITLARLALLAAAVLWLGGCDKFESHPYEIDLNHRNLNQTATERIEQICEGKETIRFALISDTQRWYDETEKMARSINSRGDIDFVVHCGDLTDFGLNDEFDWMHRSLSKLNIPYAALIGNHDLQGNGPEIFRKMYGPYNFSFMAGTVKFVCLDTNWLELDVHRPVPDFKFMQEQMEDGRPWDRTVVAMHAGPGNEQWNDSSEMMFQTLIKQYPGLQFCIHGHTHSFDIRDCFDDGVLYYCAPAAKKRAYLIFTISKEGYDYELVEF